MQDLENNNWITLDLLGSIYEIYANLTVTTLLNLKNLWTTRTELCRKGTFVKASFIFVTIILGIFENPKKKNLIKTPFLFQAT